MKRIDLFSCRRTKQKMYGSCRYKIAVNRSISMSFCLIVINEGNKKIALNSRSVLYQLPIFMNKKCWKSGKEYLEIIILL